MTQQRSRVAEKSQACLLERLLMKAGFELVHDGQNSPCQVQLPPEEVSCYTKKYRWKIDGKFVNTWVRFFYDKRGQFADFEIYSRDPDLKGREKMLMSQPAEEVQSEQASLS